MTTYNSYTGILNLPVVGKITYDIIFYCKDYYPKKNLKTGYLTFTCTIPSWVETAGVVILDIGSD